MLLKAPANAILSALKMALAIVGTKENRLNTNTIHWSITPTTLTISAVNDAPSALHTVQIPAKQQPGSEETLFFCQTVKDAKAMTARAFGGGQMEIGIEQTVLASNSTDAKYTVEAVWAGHARTTREIKFTGVACRFPNCGAMMPTDVVVASISGSKELMLEFLTPLPTRQFKVTDSGVEQSLPARSSDLPSDFAHVVVVGEITETFNTELPLCFLQNCVYGTKCVMEFTGQGNPIKLHCELYGAMASCLFMPHST